MNITLTPSLKKGTVSIPSSKSQVHRLLILAALSAEPVTLWFDGLSKDIKATADCLNALGADIQLLDEHTLHVQPITHVPDGLCHLFCGESGSTLRFMLPVVGMLGASAVFHMEGRLPNRPLAPLDSLLTTHGMALKATAGGLLYCSGKLIGGRFSIPGNISSQYISGLLMTLPFADGESFLEITGEIESSGYIRMTEDVLRLAHIDFSVSGASYRIPGDQTGHMPASLRAEGDYSNAAFFLSIGALSPEGLTVKGLSRTSSQGDRAVVEILRRFGAEVRELEDGYFIRGGHLKAITINAAPIPDLIPVLSVVASVAEGQTVVEKAGRLRLKESDRLRTTCDLLLALGADIRESGDDGLLIQGRPQLGSGTVSACGDHRIAMSAAVASCVCTGPVTIEGSECTAKSYPRFFEDFAALEEIGR